MSEKRKSDRDKSKSVAFESFGVGLHGCPQNDQSATDEDIMRTTNSTNSHQSGENENR